jgi:hypothetical protein
MPLRARESRRPLSGIVTPVVSDALDKQLRAWIEASLYQGDAERIAVRLDIQEALEDDSCLYDEAWIEVDDLYLVVDALLDLNGNMPGHYGKERAWLQQILDDALSIYTLSPDGCALAHRADPIATDAMQYAIRAVSDRGDAGSAGEHLATAWTHAFGIEPDTSKAYGEAIKAVEAAGHAIIEPNNDRATLGTMLGHLRANKGQFCLMLPMPGRDIEPIIGMMAALWEGQTSRHAGKKPTRKEELYEARAAVHLAVTLVHLFGVSMVQAKPPGLAVPPPRRPAKKAIGN